MKQKYDDNLKERFRKAVFRYKGVIIEELSGHDLLEAIEESIGWLRGHQEEIQGVLPLRVPELLRLGKSEVKDLDTAIGLYHKGRITPQGMRWSLVVPVLALQEAIRIKSGQ